MATLTVRGVQIRERVRALDVTSVLWVAVVAVMLVMVLNPLAWLLYTSLRVEGGGLTLAHYLSVATTPRYLGPVANSFLLAFSVAVLSLLVAAPAAWGAARTDMPLGGLVRMLVLASFATPPFLGALAWILLASPNAGVLNRAFVGLFGVASGPLNIYSMPGLIFVVTLYQFPIVFMLITSALSAMASDVEDAANVLGAGTIRTAATIVLPLLLPALLGGFLLAFLDALSVFGAPAMIGSPARFRVITTEIWALFQYPARYEAGSALALLLLLVTVCLLYIQRRALGRRGFATLTGKGGVKRLIRLGPWRYVLLGYCLLLLLCSLGLPYLMLLQASFSKAWGAGFSINNLTLDQYRFVLVDFQSTRNSILNSFQLAVMAATVVALLTAAAAYVSERRLVRGHQVLTFVALAPMVLPSIVLAVGMFFAYTRPPLFLYGTLWVLLVAYATKALPVAFTSSRAAVRSIHRELDEAARVMGASTLRCFRDVTLPLMKNGIGAAWILVFIMSLRELSSAVFLYTAKTQVIAVSILNLQAEGNLEAAAVLGVVLLVTTFGIVGIGYRLLGRDILEMRM